MKRSKLFLAALVPALASGASAQASLLAIHGNNPGDELGRSVDGGVDLDQDGWEDLLIGVPFDDRGGLVDNGSARLVSGLDGSILQEWFGTAADDRFGWSVAFLGDVDGDGWVDLVIGAPNARAAVGTGRPGRVSIISGKTLAELHTIQGGGNGDEWGHAVAPGPDVNFDGLPDVTIGAPGLDWQGISRDSGSIWVHSGLTGAYVRGIVTAKAGSRMGTSVGLAGDVNGNGTQDVILGAPGTDGRGEVTVWEHYPTGGVTFLRTWKGDSLGDEFGTSVASADVNGDGIPDQLIGAPGDDDGGADAGSVRVFDGLTSTGQTWHGEQPGDELGTVVAILGDLDGDGTADIAAGAPAVAIGGSGAVHVFSTGKGTALLRIDGLPGSGMGAAVSTAGDFDQDGAPDLAVGAPASNSRGLVQVTSGGCHEFLQYCTAGSSSSGCSATISAVGAPSATQSAPFRLEVANVEGGQPGLFFFGWNGRQANAWGNGTSFQCVVPPVLRGGRTSAGGTPGQCDGVSTQDMNALWQLQPQKNPGPGISIQAQFWYLDPLNTSNRGSSLSDAVEFRVCP